jgi:hypothetical protein
LSCPVKFSKLNPMFHHLILILSVLLLASCSLPFNLTDRSGNTFVIENPQLERGRYLEYRIGNATRELGVDEIVFLSIEDEPTVFDGKVFYPAKLSLEDTAAVPKEGFICVEGTLIAENAGQNLSIPLANIKEIKRQEKK